MYHLPREMFEFVRNLPECPEHLEGEDMTTEQYNLYLWMERWKESLCPHHQGFAAEYARWDSYDNLYDYHRSLEEDWDCMMDYHWNMEEQIEAEQALSEYDLYLMEQDVPPEPYDLWDYQEDYLDDRRHRKIPYTPY